MKTIGLIPARGGSKRFKNKNLSQLNDKPLIAWTIEAALQSGVVDRLILSSDEDKILDIGRAYLDQGLELHKRSEELSSDHATAQQVLTQILENYAVEGEQYDACCLLLPTCPFRSADDIRDSLVLLTEDYDAIISMKESPLVPQFMFQKDDNGLAHSLVDNSQVHQGKTRKQDYPSLYYPNGAIYWAWSDKFVENSGFYCDRLCIYPMPEYRSVDIDIEEDLVYANAIWERFIKPGAESSRD